MVLHPEQGPTAGLVLDHSAAETDLPAETRSDRSRSQKADNAASNGRAGCNCGRHTTAEVSAAACGAADHVGPADGPGIEDSGLSGSDVDPSEAAPVARSLEVHQHPVVAEVEAVATAAPVEAVDSSNHRAALVALVATEAAFAAGTMVAVADLALGTTTAESPTCPPPAEWVHNPAVSPV